MDWACDAHGSPEAYHLANVLVLAAYTLARRGFCLQMLLEDVSLTLWFALLGDSGIGKTSTIDMAERFIRDVWVEAGVDIKDPFVEPSGSIAGLLSALQEHYDERRDTTVAILQHDELAQVFATREPIAELLCKLCDGRDVHHLTKTAQRNKGKGHGTKLLRPKLSAIFASTEAQLADNFRTSHRAGGMFGRIQWLRPILTTTYVKHSSYKQADIKASKARRKAAVNAWADWEGRLSELSNTGLLVQFNEDAAEHIDTLLFKPFKKNLETGQNTDNMHGTRMRLVRRAQVMAAIFALCRLSLEVSLEDAEIATKLAGGLYGHATAASDLGTDEHNRLCNKVEAVVLSTGDMGCERKTIYGKVRVNKRILDEVLDTLADRDLVIPDRQRGHVHRYLHADTDRGRLALGLEKKNRAISTAINEGRQHYAAAASPDDAAANPDAKDSA
jgi:hypothetical protein